MEKTKTVNKCKYCGSSNRYHRRDCPENLKGVNLRSDEEYLKIWEEYGRPESFTIEDMKSIDEALYVSMNLKPHDKVCN